MDTHSLQRIKPKDFSTLFPTDWIPEDDGSLPDTRAFVRKPLVETVRDALEDSADRVEEKGHAAHYVVQHYKSRLSTLEKEQRCWSRFHGIRGAPDLLSNLSTLELSPSLISPSIPVQPRATGTALPASEVLLHIQVFNSSLSRVDQEFLVPGSQPLSALRDRIHCITDHEYDGKEYKAASFFIEGNFFDDERYYVQFDNSNLAAESSGDAQELKEEEEGEAQEEEEREAQEGEEDEAQEHKRQEDEDGEPQESKDATTQVQPRFSQPMKLSTPILQWSDVSTRQRAGGWGALSSHRMSDVCWDDLQPRIGAHYLYLHQGDHEHIISILDIRLRGSRDPEFKEQYPLLLFQSRPTRKQCTCCSNIARYKPSIFL